AVRKEAGVSPLAGSVGEYNWGGAGGTYFWVDPKENMFVVFMMQSPKQRVADPSLLKDMIYAASVKEPGPGRCARPGRCASPGRVVSQPEAHALRIRAPPQSAWPNAFCAANRPMSCMPLTRVSQAAHFRPLLSHTA